MKDITAEEIKAATLSTGIKRIDHHSCSICGYMTCYIVDGEDLFFDPGCDCSRMGPAPIELRSWQEAADWVNMQRSHEQKLNVMAKFAPIIS